MIFEETKDKLLQVNSFKGYKTNEVNDEQI